jgi:hypothetical protein
MDSTPFEDLDDPTRVPGLGGHGDLLSNGPHDSRQFSGDGDHDVIGVFATRPELPVPCTQSHLRLPTDVLDTFGEFFQAALQMAAHVGRIAIRPGPFDQGTAGMHVAGCCDAALATPFSTGIFGRRQSQVMHERAGGINTGQIAQFGHDGDGPGALHTPQRLEGLDHRGQTPGGDLLVTVLFKPPEAFRVFGDGPPVCLANALRRRRRTDDLR